MPIFKQKRLTRPRWLVALQRDIRVFTHLFPWRITVIMLVGLILTAHLFRVAHHQWQGELISPLKALFAVINMTFFQLTFADMPADSRLDIFPQRAAPDIPLSRTVQATLFP